MEGQSKYYAQSKYEADTFFQIFEYRGLIYVLPDDIAFYQDHVAFVLKGSLRHYLMPHVKT